MAVYQDCRLDQDDQPLYQVAGLQDCQLEKGAGSAELEEGGPDGSGGGLVAEEVLERAFGIALSLEALRTLYFSTGGPLFRAVVKFIQTSWISFCSYINECFSGLRMLTAAGVLKTCISRLRSAVCPLPYICSRSLSNGPSLGRGLVFGM